MITSPKWRKANIKLNKNHGVEINQAASSVKAMERIPSFPKVNNTLSVAERNSAHATEQ